MLDDLITKRVETISRLCLRKQDIMELTGFKETKARQIMEICRKEFGGEIKARFNIDSAITTDSFLKYMKTNRREYIASLIDLKRITQGNDDEEDL